MPEPTRIRTRPSTSSAINASRTVGRDTFNCSAISRSVGSFEPTAYSPLSINARS
jgi:hypothetical protein